jgi:Tol biopolymer transport system component
MASTTFAYSATMPHILSLRSLSRWDKGEVEIGIEFTKEVLKAVYLYTALLAGSRRSRRPAPAARPSQVPGHSRDCTVAACLRGRSRRRSHASIQSMKYQLSSKPQMVFMLFVVTTWLFAFSACSEKVQGRIAFASSKDGDIHIYVMAADGSGVRQVTDEPGVDDSWPAWSPDGTKIAFQRRRGETDGLGLTGPVDIYVTNADGSGLRQLTIEGAGPAWSPDGSRIAFASDRNGQSDIYVMNADGSGVARLTSDPAGDSMPAWSPDGSRIAFASDRNGHSDIYVMNADGSQVQQLTNDAADDFVPAWSPEGDRIAFAKGRMEQSDVYVMNSDGSALHQLTHDPASAGAPAWSPDGNVIVFASNREGDFDIYTMHADGSALEKLTDLPGDEGLPAWSAR